MVTRRQRRRTGQGGVARDLLVLLLMCLLAGGVIRAELPRVRRLLAGTLLGDTPGTGGPIPCRGGNVLATVPNPSHLALLAPCQSAYGRVLLVLHARDGDTHISLLPDRGYWPLLDRRNYLLQGVTLVVEVAPADRAGVTIPSVGAHVRVTGAYVVDREYGWREIHPAWQIVSIS
ncbi:MAG TPA: hypothetical protein VNL71_18695 [Chloroflexota bacterium]|nr:hypothetical protein [Chloroflexota bacterium]